MARLATLSDGSQVKASIYPAKSPVLRRNGFKVMVSKRYSSSPSARWYEDSWGVTSWYRTRDKALRAACHYLDAQEKRTAKVKERLRVTVDVEDCNT